MGPFQMRVVLLTEPITKMAMLMLPQQTLIPMRHLFFSLSLLYISLGATLALKFSGAE